MKRLKRSFYTKKSIDVSRELLGKVLVRIKNGKRISGKIVETEMYLGPQDKASHAFKGKITERNKVEYQKGGFVYIYLCYGMYWQFNIVSFKKGNPECVLIRALEPLEGIDLKRKEKELRKECAGPGRLSRWMELNRSFNGEDLVNSERIWVEEGEEIKKQQIIAAKRIGIDYAGSWAEKPWRFYIKDNIFVSRY
jgi:DNA-3-methyladenine glycosylase